MLSTGQNSAKRPKTGFSGHNGAVTKFPKRFRGTIVTFG